MSLDIGKSIKQIKLTKTVTIKKLLYRAEKEPVTLKIKDNIQLVEFEFEEKY